MVYDAMYWGQVNYDSMVPEDDWDEVVVSPDKWRYLAYIDMLGLEQEDLDDTCGQDVWEWAKEAAREDGESQFEDFEESVLE